MLKVKSGNNIYYYLAAFILGAALNLSLAPFNITPICFGIFSSFIYLQRKLILRKQASFVFFALGFSFGLGYFTFGLYWIFYAFIILYDNSINFMLYSALSGLALSLLFIYLGLYWGLASFCAGFFTRNLAAQTVAFALFMGLCEWLRGHLFTGFPWNLVGYSAATTPLTMQVTALIGIYSLTSLCVLVYCTPALLFCASARKIFVIGFSILAVIVDLLYGYLCLAKAPALPSPLELTSHTEPNYNTSYNIRLVQPSIKQLEKLNPAYSAQNFYKYIELSTSSNNSDNPSLIVWPETAIDFLLPNSPAALKIIKNTFRKQQRIIIGAPRAEARKIYNSALLLDSHGKILSYSDKIHLVPFGEYIPLSHPLKQLFPGFSALFSGYTAGSQRHTISLTSTQAYLPLICYEAIFPDEMSYIGPKPTFILNMTNDAWYGTSTGPFQHFQQSRLRAVEQRLPLIRVGNNGISAIIDPYGRIVKSLGLNEIGIIDGNIPSPYVSIWHEKNKKEKNNFNLFLGHNTVFLLLSAILSCLMLCC